jgi:hypothetical protein
VKFTVAWKLKCTRGSRGGCEAAYIAYSPHLENRKHPYETYFTVKTAKAILRFSDDSHRCQSSCSRTKFGKHSFQLVLSLGLDRFARSDESISIKIKRLCQSKQLTPKTLSIHFDSRGGIDRAKSRLS